MGWMTYEAAARALDKKRHEVAQMVSRGRFGSRRGPDGWEVFVPEPVDPIEAMRYWVEDMAEHAREAQEAVTQAATSLVSAWLKHRNQCMQDFFEAMRRSRQAVEESEAAGPTSFHQPDRDGHRERERIVAYVRQKIGERYRASDLADGAGDHAVADLALRAARLLETMAASIERGDHWRDEELR